MKICKDCRYHRYKTMTMSLHDCYHPKVIIICNVTGGETGVNCYTRRESDGGCGEKGTDFKKAKLQPEPKKRNWLWTFLSRPPIGMPYGP